MQAWKEAWQAQGETSETTGRRRHGWTMAAALIWHMQRRRGLQSAAQGGGVQPAGPARSVVVYDVETTTLIDEHVRVEDMEVSVACATRLPAAATKEATWAAAEHGTFWHADARGVSGSAVERLLEWFDAADAIVAYNGRAFDMRVMERVYAGDAERARSHMAKLMDPMEVVQRACGRRVRLSHLLALNGGAQKAGAGCDAPRLWERGQMEQLERYCRRDVEALAGLVMKDSIRVPGGTTSDASVAPRLRAAHVMEDSRDSGAEQQDDARGAHDAGREPQPSRRRQRTGGEARANEGDGGGAAQMGEQTGGVSGSDATRAYDEGSKPKRQRRTPVPTYDEVVRRKPHRKRGRIQYVERGRGAKGASSRRVEVGPLAIDRTVAQRYEWRDAQLQQQQRTRAGTQQPEQKRVRAEREKRAADDDVNEARRTTKRRQKDPG